MELKVVLTSLPKKFPPVRKSVLFWNHHLARYGFSFANGFLGFGKDYEFSSDAGDTLFYYNPLKEGCSSLKAWAIKINDDTLKIEKNEKYACSGASVEFVVESGWKNITWSSQTRGMLGSTQGISVSSHTTDTVSVTLSNVEGLQNRSQDGC
jgi:hypothetical protein